MFSLLCEGNSVVNTTALGSIEKFGGPILYLFVYSFVLLLILVWADSGSRVPRRLRPRKGTSSGSGTMSSSKEDDVIAAADAVSKSDDLLRVLNVSKTYNGNQVVDDVSLGIPRDTLFALLGPNGAGKTTTFNIIRECASS
jgi:ATP-binding cassette subfamily A (ABC1) protein 3